MTFAAYANFTGNLLLSRDTAEQAREDAAKVLTYVGSNWTDHLDSVTVVEIPDDEFTAGYGNGRDMLRSIAVRRFRVVERA